MRSSKLQYIALIWAELPIRDLVLLPMPLLIELRTYARDRQAGKCQDIFTFLHSGNITCRLDRHDDNLDVQLTTAKDSAQSQKDWSQILEFLYNLTQDSDEKINPSQAALEAIVKNYPDRSEVLDLLLDRSKNDPDEQVRKYAEEQLVIWRARTA